MKNLTASFTVMTPQHSVEQAYYEWVIKAVELVIQSRIVLDSTVRPSRQFALNLSEKFDARGKILCDSQNFFHNGAIVVVHALFQDKIIERWIFSFDPPRDVLPTTRSERKDLTLPRRLSVALRALMSLTRILRIERNVIIELNETDDGGSILSSQMSDPLTRIDVCSIPSSFGSLTLKVFTRDSSSATTRISSPARTPATGAVTPVRLPSMVIDETFIQTHSLGNIEMVIETATLLETHARSMPVIPVPLSNSPPRDLTEIWPSSSLSYPASPRDRRASGDSGFSSDDDAPKCCLVTIPLLASDSDQLHNSSELSKLLKEASGLGKIFEKPVSISSVTEFIDQLKRSRQKSFSR